MMTADELRAWVKRRGFKHKEAAVWLGLSLDGLHNYLYRHRPISAPTQRIIELSDELSGKARRPVGTAAPIAIITGSAWTRSRPR
jgi:hypothetical protein